MKKGMCWLLPAILMVVSCKKVAEENPCINCRTAKTESILDPVQLIEFRGIRPDDPNGTEPIDNPERGFRFYYSMHASNLNQPFWAENYTNITSQLDRDEPQYGNNKIRLTLINFYLTEFLHTTISANALANMQHIFDQLKNRGQKVILRFIYRAFDSDEYEELQDISTHLAQLSSFLINNEPTIHVVQAGFVGIWGEWHSSGLDGWPLEQKVVIRKLLATVPASRKIQVRETAIKNNTADAFSGFIHYTFNGGGQSGYESYPALTQAEKDRIGFHNDYFILDVGSSEQISWDYAYPDADFFQVQNEGRYTTVDGEWPEDNAYTQIPHGNLSGWAAARRMRAHGYTSFNIMANYSNNITAWKADAQQVTASQFRNDNTLVTDDYFINQFGEEVPRTAYQYIRDHLGYRLQLRYGKFPVFMRAGKLGYFDFAVKNFGFSKMINSRPVYLVLIDGNNTVREIPTDSDARDFVATYGQDDGVYTIHKTVYNSYAPGRYRIGIWMPDASTQLRYNPAYAVKLANRNIEWWTDPTNRYLINIVGALDVR
jgi:hypothetical protein